MTLAPDLVRLLVCPEDKLPLWYSADDSMLYNERLRRRYNITDDIPVLLVEDAEAVDEAEHTRITQRAAAGELTQTGTMENEDE